ncbi:MAG TPA: hemerythrin domain-containing protein [Candidatus Baltobacteraceae bacterium]|nr:hemerythrin domain-containing protein [Candidatus Baltobacteraceae bacterium]
MQSDANVLPLRGSSVHEILENDHETIKGLLNSLTHAAANADRMQTLEQLKGVLTIHNATEENIVYPALNKIAGHKFETMKLYNETASADMLVFELDTMLKEGDDTKFAQKAEALQKAVFKHIEAEEKHALPHLEDGADSEEAVMLLQSVRDFRNSIKISPARVPTAHTYTGEVGSETPSRTPMG